MFEEGIPRRLPDQFACESPAFSALYYTVLALGCQSHRGTSFKARTDAAWKLYQPALELLSETITAEDTLLTVQVSYHAINFESYFPVNVIKAITAMVS
jgi:hypothetical protein